METKVALALMAAGLFLFCACTEPGDATSTSTEIPSWSTPSTPAPTTMPVLTDTSSASQVSATVPPDKGPLEKASVNRTSGNPAVDLTIQVQTTDQAIAGERNSYTLTIRNLGPDLATGIVVTDDLPTGMVPVWTHSPQPVCVQQGTAVGCNLGELRGNDSATVTLDISIDRTDTLTTGTQLAGLTLELSSPTCTLDRDETQPAVTCQVPRLEPDTAVRLHVGVKAASWMRKPAVHTVTVSANENDTDWTNNHTSVTMMIDEPMVLAATPVPTAADLSLHAEGPSTIIAGQPLTYTYTVTNRGAMEATGITFVNTLPPATDLVAFEPSAPACEQVNDTFVCRLHSPGTSEPVTFTLVITGNSEQPMSLDLDPLTPGWPICAVIKERSYLQLLNCSLGTLREGEAAQVRFGLVARGTQDRKMVNSASVYADEPELNPLDNTKHITTLVKIEADLSIQSVLSSPLVVDEAVSYTLTIKNDGPSDANEVILVDVLPPGTTVISTAAIQGVDCQVDASTNRVVCRIGRLDSGETAAVAVVVAVDPLTETITHSASVLARPDDPDPSNNEMTESIPTTGGASGD